MDRHRLRLKLPNGAELEAEGDVDFVRAERATFLHQQTGDATTKHTSAPNASSFNKELDWNELIHNERGIITLRGKVPGLAENDPGPVMLLIAASGHVAGNAKPNATQLAKSLRASGYAVARMDRLLADALAQGHVLASGSRRARRYELTSSGKIKAILLAEVLSKTIRGAA